MKKIVLVLAIIATISFTSCKNEESKTDTMVENVDSTATTNDTIVVTNDSVPTEKVTPIKQ